MYHVKTVLNIFKKNNCIKQTLRHCVYRVKAAPTRQKTWIVAQISIRQMRTLNFILPLNKLKEMDNFEFPVYE